MLVKQEMLNTYTVLLKYHNIASQKLHLRVKNTQLSRGVTTLRKSKVLFLELLLVQCHSSFTQHVDIVSPPLLAQKYVFIRCPDIQTPDNVINNENQALHQVESLGTEWISVTSVTLIR